MAFVQTAPSTLESLEASVQAMLMQVGSIFNDMSNPDSRHVLRHSTRMQRTLPASLAQFHDAMNDLESEVIMARDTLLRDLADFRAEKLQSNATAAIKAPTPTLEAAVNVQEPEENTVMAEGDDFVIVENPKTTPPPKSPSPLPLGQPEKDVTSEATSVDHALAQQSKPDEAEQKSPKTIEPATEQSANDDIFDNLFEDLEDNDTEEKDTQVANSKPTENASESNAQPEQQSQPNEDASAAVDVIVPDDNNEDTGLFLPGLEEYANNSAMNAFDGMDNFDELNMMGSTTGPEDAFDLSGIPDDIGQQSSNFDNLFPFDDSYNNDNENTAPGQSSLQNMEFDDDFFNLDGNE